MRAYARYLRQIRSRFTVGSMARTLSAHPSMTQDLSSLFAIRFDPATKGREKAAKDQAANPLSAHWSMCIQAMTIAFCAIFLT